MRILTLRFFMLLLLISSLIIGCGEEDELLTLENQQVSYRVFCSECLFRYSINGREEDGATESVSMDTVEVKGNEISYCGFMQYTLISETGSAYVESILDGDIVNILVAPDRGVYTFKIETGCQLD